MIDNVSTTIQQKLVVIKDAYPSIRIERAFLDLKFGKIRSRLNNKYVLVVLLTLQSDCLFVLFYLLLLNGDVILGEFISSYKPVLTEPF